MAVYYKLEKYFIGVFFPLKKQIKPKRDILLMFYVNLIG